MFVKGVGLVYQGDGEVVSEPLAPDVSQNMGFENGAASGAMSALLWARMEGRGDRESIRLAAAAASLSMKQVTSVFPDLDARLLLEYAGMAE